MPCVFRALRAAETLAVTVLKLRELCLLQPAHSSLLLEKAYSGVTFPVVVNVLLSFG